MMYYLLSQQYLAVIKVIVWLQDLLACEMFQLIAKEAELAKTVLEYARLQRSYHQAALDTLDELIPELESSICKCEFIIHC